MSLTDEMYALRVDLWGDKAADAYAEALDALHVFAQRSGCMPGGSVTKWFDEQCELLCAAERRLMDERRRRSPAPINQQPEDV